MDLPPPVQEPDGARRPGVPGSARPSDAGGAASVAPGELEWRLSQLESGLRHIDRRLDRLEQSIADTVAQQTQAVAGDVRRTLSELGRRLVLELPQVLARHRDEIVAELRPAAVPVPPEPTAEAEPEPPAPSVVAPPTGDGGREATASIEAPPKRRRRVHVLRQRDA